MREAQESITNQPSFGSLIHVILPEGTNGCKYAIHKRQVTFGRNTSCEVRIQNTNVSDKHALLTVDNDGLFWLKSLNESTKTYFNGIEVHEDTLIGHNNVFTIGNNWFRLEYCPEISAAFSPMNVRQRLLNTAALTDITAQSQQSVTSNNLLCLSEEGSSKQDTDVKKKNDERVTEDKYSENISSLSPETQKKRKSDVHLSARAKKTPRTPLHQSKRTNTVKDGALPTESASTVPENMDENRKKAPSYLSPVIGKTRKLFSVRSSARAAMKSVSLTADSPPLIRKMKLTEMNGSQEQLLPSQGDSPDVRENEKQNHEQPSKADGKGITESVPASDAKLISPHTPQKHNVRVLLSPNRLPTSIRKSLKRRLLHTPRRKLLQDFTSVNLITANRLSELSSAKQSLAVSGAVLTEIKDENVPEPIPEEIIHPESSNNGAETEGVTITSTASKIDNDVLANDQPIVKDCDYLPEPSDDLSITIVAHVPDKQVYNTLQDQTEMATNDIGREDFTSVNSIAANRLSELSSAKQSLVSGAVLTEIKDENIPEPIPEEIIHPESSNNGAETEGVTITSTASKVDNDDVLANDQLIVKDCDHLQGSADDLSITINQDYSNQTEMATSDIGREVLATIIKPVHIAEDSKKDTAISNCVDAKNLDRCQGFTKARTRCKKQGPGGWCWLHKTHG